MAQPKLNNFLRCGDNPGKHSFHGKGKPEKKSQDLLEIGFDGLALIEAISLELCTSSIL